MVKKLTLLLIFTIALLNTCIPVSAVGNELLPIPEWEKAVDDFAADQIGMTTAGAAVAVIQDGSMLWSKAYGQANIEKQILLTTDAVFDWASCSKLILWTAVMQCVERGEIELDSDIREYLPEGFFKKLRFDEPITMLNLMNHNAGWEEVMIAIFSTNPNDILPLGEFLQTYEPAQIRRPGEVVSYSNFGASLAGYIVERVSGLEYFEYVNKNIFNALGMDDTSIHPTLADRPDLSARRTEIVGHKGSNGNLYRSKNERAYCGFYPGGSAIGTVGDAAKFVAALVPGEGEQCPLFQNSDTLSLMLSSSLDYSDGTNRIAHGFFDHAYTDAFTVTALSHTGGMESFTSIFLISPQEQFGLVVLVNQANPEFMGGLPIKLLGLAEIEPEENNMLPDARGLQGVYMTTRRPSGLLSIGYELVMGRMKVTALNENTLKVYGEQYHQIRPYVFKLSEEPTMSLPAMIVFEVDENGGIRLNYPSADSLRMTFFEAAMIYIKLGILGLAIVYMLIACGIFLINAIKRNGSLKHFSQKLNLGLNMLGLIISVNTAVVVIKALSWSGAPRLFAHIWVNRAYLIFAPIFTLIMLLTARGDEIPRKDKEFCLFTAVACGLMLLGMVLCEMNKIQ